MDAQTVRIEIRIVGRWNARALLDRLAPYRSYLVQHGSERWVVHAEAPGCRGESLESALAQIETCLDERAVGEASIRIDGQPCRLTVAAGARA